MTKQEIFAVEDDNNDKIYLFLEGTFWKAYEKSAFHFVKFVKPYKPSKKDIKYLNREVVSIGFPEDVLDEIKTKLTLIEQTTDRVVFEAPGIVDQEEFIEWKSALIKILNNVKPKINADNGNSNSCKDIVERIRNFTLESKTPMECMMFIAELKKTITQNALQPTTRIQSIV